MPPNRYCGPPMTLANMREQGMRSSVGEYELCHHAGAGLRPANGVHELRHLGPTSGRIGLQCG
jgi:hypothetical protein